MNIGLIIAVVIIVLVVLLAGFIVYRRRPRKLKTDKFVDEWRTLQTMIRDKANWAPAVVNADEMLDRALKRRRMKGKTMGERLVSAQRLLTDNDDVWFAHNLAKKIINDGAVKLKEADVKDALVGFRQALRDIGALPTTKSEETHAGTKA